MTLQQQIVDLRKYHEALGTKLASLERHLEADEVLKAPTMERQPDYAVSSDSSVMHEGKRYSFKYHQGILGSNINDAYVIKSIPGMIETDKGTFTAEAITNVREAKEPAKEWEIVEFGNDTDIYTLKNGVWYLSTGNDYQYNLVTLLSTQPVRAVRRLSDGTTWRVWDKVNVGTYDAIQVINQFWIETSTIMMCETTGMIVQINALRKPDPLFTTADGVQVPDGATVWFWNSCTEVEERIADSLLIPTMHYSTREAAQSAYDKWLFEQPVLTLNDITQDGFPLEYLETMKRIVKEKIAKK